ncbi:MAG: lactate utilization protein [Clostridia bacterium]|nr:lactate utilization protein [Clostridia bacterium]
MDYKHMRNELMAQKLIKNFERRNMEAYYCPTKEEVLAKAKELVPEGSSITWGGSVTIRDIGLTKMFDDGNYKALDRDKVKNPEEYQSILRKAFELDWYLTSANAITEDGLIVNIDGLGNRVAAITFGPKNVLFVVSLDKLAKDAESAVKRVRTIAAPINAARFDNMKTPCKVDGLCHNCNAPGCICNFVHIVRNSGIKNRIKIILMDDNYGF